jgi:hypothetical protein
MSNINTIHGNILVLNLGTSVCDADDPRHWKIRGTTLQLDLQSNISNVTLHHFLADGYASCPGRYPGCTEGTGYLLGSVGLGRAGPDRLTRAER